jgi:hypothetical protein
VSGPVIGRDRGMFNFISVSIEWLNLILKVELTNSFGSTQI